MSESQKKFEEGFEEIFKVKPSAVLVESALKMANTELMRQIEEHRDGGSE